MKQFTVAATGVSMNYMPQYLAQELGFFKDEGLDLVSYTPTPWADGLGDVNNKKADVLLGGIWVPIMYRGYIKDYVSVAKIASKCPLVIVSREKVTPFSWNALEDKRVLVSGGDGASHYAMALGSAKNNGVDVSKIRFIHDFSTPMICELFEGGFADFIVVQPDIAAKMIENNIGHFFCDLASTDDDIPWSVYYTLAETIESDPDKFTDFVAGLQRGTTYLLENGGEACRAIIEKYWSHVPIEEGIKTIDEFIEQGMWTPSVKIQKNELDCWQEYLVLADLVDEVVDYDLLVDHNPHTKSLEKTGGN